MADSGLLAGYLFLLSPVVWSGLDEIHQAHAPSLSHPTKSPPPPLLLLPPPDNFCAGTRTILILGRLLPSCRLLHRWHDHLPGATSLPRGDPVKNGLTSPRAGETRARRWHGQLRRRQAPYGQPAPPSAETIRRRLLPQRGSTTRRCHHAPNRPYRWAPRASLLSPCHRRRHPPNSHVVADREEAPDAGFKRAAAAAVSVVGDGAAWRLSRPA
jgi:hypothetical protein